MKDLSETIKGIRKKAKLAITCTNCMSNVDITYEANFYEKYGIKEAIEAVEEAMREIKINDTAESYSFRLLKKIEKWKSEIK